MARILIVGATGLLGRELVTACKARGDEVHALVRPAARFDAAKMQPLQSAGATVHEGDVKDYGSLLKACQAVDSVISALGSMQIGDEGPVIQAVKAARVKRFIPSDFGLDPAATGAGSCVLFDAKAAVHKSIREAGIPYTLVHSNGFFAYWVFSLGDLSKLGGQLPPAEVNVYGDGNTKGAFVSVPDVATVTARAVSDPKMKNKELRIVANTHTQNELIDLWQKKSGRKVARVPVSVDQIEKTIASSTAPDQMMTMVVAQLHRSVWVRGDANKRAGSASDATTVYPDIKLQTVEQAFAQML